MIQQFSGKDTFARRVPGPSGYRPGIRRASDSRSELMHGKASEVRHDGKTIFAGLEDRFLAGRYHSLIVEKESLPACLEISAYTADDIIMGLRHRQLKVEGVQFHPESILTSDGKQLLANFLKL